VMYGVFLGVVDKGIISRSQKLNVGRVADVFGVLNLIIYALSVTCLIDL